MHKKILLGFIIVIVVFLGLGGYFYYKNTTNPPVLPKNTPPPNQTVSYLTSKEDPTKYCNGADMNSTDYQKTINTQNSTTTSEVSITKLQTIKKVIDLATNGMCHDVVTRLNITENNGTVYIPPIDGWAGSSIVMCSCKPEIEVNILQISGITNVVWSDGSQKTDLIRVQNPLPNQTISSPLAITGEARGSWFFEASFPVVLVDWDGKIIAQGIAQAKSDWMTTNFVPFKATLNFTADTTVSNRGTLILKKDNPSGLPKNDDALEIPIIFTGKGDLPVACTAEAKLCPDGSAVGRTGPKCEFASCP